MRCSTAGLAAVLALLPCIAHGHEGHEPNQSDFEFFANEAEVVSASHRPQPLHLAPATVHVVTAEEIRASGAQTLWDALRSVPGVDVVTSRAFQGEVGIRGLNRALNNRTLVLLDGVTVLNGFGDFVTWESIPVSLEEIDRIEVVQGAASALYGANAVNGVVHIITKTPDQLPRGMLSYAGGQRNTNLGSVLLVGRRPHADSKLSVAWRSTHGFEDPSRPSSEVAKFNAVVRWRPSAESDIRVAAAAANINTQVTTGPAGVAFDDGPVGFGRIDLRYRDTKLRAFWNRGRTALREFNVLQEPRADYDTYDLTLTQAVGLPMRHEVVVGGSLRRNAMRAPVLSSEADRQDLAALFFEDSWCLSHHWTLVTSVRLDRHPRTRYVLSPRASLLHAPNAAHVLRLSAGSSFRNPTLIENYLNITQSYPNPGSLPNPPYTTLQQTFAGNRDLDHERLELFEVSHRMQKGRLSTTMTGFHYHLKGIVATTVTTDPGAPPVFQVVQSFVNQGRIEAWGGEAGAEVHLGHRTRGFLNYSYQSLIGETAFPRHKVNAGLRYAARRWNANVSAHWVDSTTWALMTTPDGPRAPVDAYWLLNGSVGYEFDGRLDGLGLGLSVFNLLDREHYEILPAASALEPGQSGERVGSRWLLGVTYRVF